MLTKRTMLKGMALIVLLVSLTGFHPQPVLAETEMNIEPAVIDRFIQSEMEKTGIPGLAVAIVRKDWSVYIKGFGQTGDGLPVTTETPFAIASLSKSITALAVMQLAEAGKISLDASVTKYIPSFRTADPRGADITVRQLLQQTSGLTDRALPEMALSRQPDTLEEAIARFQAVKLASDPGRAYHYHNPNYQILARLVEAVSGELFGDYLQKHIFQPLQMKNTFDVANTNQFYEQDGHFPNGHIFVYGKPVAVKEPAWFIEGAAGNVSTIEDMASWLKLNLNGGMAQGVRLLSAEGIRTMHSPAGPDKSYAMGWRWNERGRQIEHNGILWTYYADQVLLPESGYGIAVLFNSGLNALTDYSVFTRGLTDILNGKEPEGSFLSKKAMEIMIGLLTAVTLFFGIRSLVRLQSWENKTRRRPKWVTALLLVPALIPSILFACLPQILTFVGGGRVLGWERIFLMMPSMFIGLMLYALVCLIIVLGRMIRLIRMR